MNRTFFNKERPFPLLIESLNELTEPTAWVKKHRTSIEIDLLNYGAILFRGFKRLTVSEFENFVITAGGELMEYCERSSPRQSVSGRIYTSTEYSSSQSIFPHNENSYANVWPMKIFFYCETPSESGGETPIVDVRRVYTRLPVSVRDKFSRLGVLYIRNFGNRLGLPWQIVFQTEKPAEVETYCQNAGYQYAWNNDKCLKIRHRGEAIIKHPRTGENLWFNHAAFFHVTTLAAEIRNVLIAQLAEEELPNNTYYGDGSLIEPSVLTIIRATYLAEAVSFEWRTGDILMLDNMLTAHGRTPYSGIRKILVGMTEPFESRNAIVPGEKDDKRANRD
ncbi:MAG: TauD/TfdA family dioxygenase [Acidobacteriota bacterium]